MRWKSDPGRQAAWHFPQYPPSPDQGIRSGGGISILTPGLFYTLSPASVFNLTSRAGVVVIGAIFGGILYSTYILAS